MQRVNPRQASLASQSEIATARRIPSGTVTGRTFSAVARLRKSLGRVPELTAGY
jgi:DNA-directed RNA polymerase specialized sigma24 family protein